MKEPIFDFEKEYPPVLTSQMLEEEQKRRRIHLQMALLAVAAVCMELCLILISVLLWVDFPGLSVICAGYVFCSSAGSGIILVVFTEKRRDVLCQE